MFRFLFAVLRSCLTLFNETRGFISLKVRKQELSEGIMNALFFKCCAVCLFVFHFMCKSPQWENNDSMPHFCAFCFVSVYFFFTSFCSLHSSLVSRIKKRSMHKNEPVMGLNCQHKHFPAMNVCLLYNANNHKLPH